MATKVDLELFRQAIRKLKEHQDRPFETVILLFKAIQSDTQAEKEAVIESLFQKLALIASDEDFAQIEDESFLIPFLEKSIFLSDAPTLKN